MSEDLPRQSASMAIDRIVPVTEGKEQTTTTAITLTPPTVGRRPADLSADDRPIKCLILALFSSADKKKKITTLLYFFHRPTVFGFRQSADDRPISGPMSYLNEPLFIGRCVGRPSADRRPTQR